MDCNLEKIKLNVLKEFYGKYIYTAHPYDAIKNMGVIKLLDTYSFFNFITYTIIIAIAITIFNVPIYAVLKCIGALTIINIIVKRSRVKEILKSTTYPYIIKINKVDTENSTVSLEAYSKLGKNTVDIPIEVYWGKDSKFLKLKIKEHTNNITCKYISDNIIASQSDGIYLDTSKPDMESIVLKYLDK